MFYYIILFLKGIIIGIGKIIPGVSGAVLAISLGIYQEAIMSFNNLFKNPKNNIKYLLSLGLGIILSVLLISGLIKFMLAKFYLTTMLFFVGLIIGGFPSLFQETFAHKINKRTLFLISLIILSSLILLKTSNNSLVINNDIKGFIMMFFLGIVEAVTMIVPGLSGTAVLLLIGAYEHVIEMLSNATNITYLFNNIGLFIFFIIGILFGLISIIKIINYLFEHHKKTTYYVIVAFSISSVLLLLKQTLSINYQFVEVLISFVFLILGFKISNLLDRIGTNSR